MGKAHRVSWMRSKKLNNQLFTRLHQHINVLITDTWKIARLESLKWPSPHKTLRGLRSSAETNTPPFECRRHRPDWKYRNESGPESFLSSLAVGFAHLSTYKWVFFLRSSSYFSESETETKMKGKCCFNLRTLVHIFYILTCKASNLNRRWKYSLGNLKHRSV